MTIIKIPDQKRSDKISDAPNKMPIKSKPRQTMALKKFPSVLITSSFYNYGCIANARLKRSPKNTICGMKKPRIGTLTSKSDRSAAPAIIANAATPYKILLLEKARINAIKSHMPRLIA